MGPNAAILIDMTLKAALQIQQYTVAVAKANAEGRDVTDEELTTVRAAAIFAVDNLEKQP